MKNFGKISLILGRPFLAITQADINVANGTITLMVEGKEVEFNLNGVAAAPMATDD